LPHEPVPQYEKNCGMTVPVASWVIVNRLTGVSVFETFQHSVASKVNQTNYRVMTALQWLSSLTPKEEGA